jgi:hypothetical protein
MIVRGMPFPEYLAHPALGSGAIRQFIKSPGHFLHYTRTKGVPPTPQMLLGSAAHCAVLEPREFNSRYAKAPDVDRRTKDGKAAWAEFLDCNPHKEILTPEQYDTAWAIKDTLSAMPEYRALLAAGAHYDVEVSCFWTDDATGLELKGRADMLRSDGVCIDLKTTIDASPHGYPHAIARYGSHIQAAIYCDAFECDRFVFVAIENKPPFAAGIYTLDEASLELGRQQYRAALDGIAKYERSGIWPIGYGEQEIGLPAWAFWEDEKEVIL